MRGGGGPFLRPPSLPSPFPAASPEISRDKLGRGCWLHFGEKMGAAAALLRALLLLGGLRSAPALGLLRDPPHTYEGPPDSYFGFALDFHMTEGR